jgi:hypothetical protein
MRTSSREVSQVEAGGGHLRHDGRPEEKFLVSAIGRGSMGSLGRMAVFMHDAVDGVVVNCEGRESLGVRDKICLCAAFALGARPFCLVAPVRRRMAAAAIAVCASRYHPPTRSRARLAARHGGQPQTCHAPRGDGDAATTTALASCWCCVRCTIPCHSREVVYSRLPPMKARQY